MWWWLGGGALLALLLGARTAQQTEDAVANGGTIDVRCTGYWPYKANLSAAERLMEGGVNDTHSNRLYTLEEFQAGQAPYVSVSGDDAIWPYGQRIALGQWPGVIFRVVDTGGNFRGAKKVYRVVGREPLDICVNGPETKLTASDTCTIFYGDDLRTSAKDRTPAEVQASLFRGQEVV